MPVLVNQESGLAEDLPQDQADRALAVGSHKIPLFDPEGKPVVATPEEARSSLASGYTEPETKDLQGLLDTAKYNAPLEKVKTGLEGAASAATFGISSGLEAKILGNEKEQVARREANPGIHGAGQVAGLLGSAAIPGFGEYAVAQTAAKEARVAIKAGELTADAAAPIIEKASQLVNPLSASSVLGGAGRLATGEGAGFASGILNGAASAATEAAIFAAGDENSKFLTNDPHQSAETAFINVGLGGLFGAGVGGTLGSLSPLWKASKETKLSQFIEDFRSQIKNRLDNPEPVKNLTEELQSHYNATTGAANEVYGATGLKAQEIQKLLPKEMSPEILTQAQTISNSVKQTIKDLGEDPFASKLRNSLEKFSTTVSEDTTPGGIFNAAQDLKQQLQEWGKFNKNLVPLAEKDFREASKKLGFEVRTALEDPAIWGKAADRQQAINKAFSEYLPTLKDFEKRFTVEVAGERQIDPGKVSTYFNQLGKSSAEIKQQMLSNFLEASEKYKNVIDQTHKNLGIESPLGATAQTAMRASLQEVTPGAKLANALVNRGLARLGGETLGAGIGGLAGHAVGAGGFGALIGEHALGPFFSSILPILAKPILNQPTSASGLKSAIDLGIASIRGETALSKATGAIFKAGEEVVPSHLWPQKETREKLDKKIGEMQSNNGPLLNVGGEAGHYMPGHGAALGAVAARATQYLQNLKPAHDRLGPLDPPSVPSRVAEATYERALDVAEQPLLALDAIKNGTLTKEDVETVHTIYPSLYASMAQKLTNEMIDHVSEGNQVPYNSRLSLSLFLGQSLDSTMTPQAIAANQPKPQQMPMQGGSEPKSKGSMAALSKLSGNYQTGSQSREANRNKA